MNGPPPTAAAAAYPVLQYHVRELLRYSQQQQAQFPCTERDAPRQTDRRTAVALVVAAAAAAAAAA